MTSEPTAHDPALPGVLPMNPAEAMIETFYDDRLSDLGRWRITPQDATGVRVWQPWGWVAFEWTAAEVGRPAFSMHRRFAVDCRGRDSLVVCVRPPEGAQLRVDVETDLGVRSTTSARAGSVKLEHVVPLDGATRITGATLTMLPGAEGSATGFLTWMAIRNTALLDAYLDQWRDHDERWPLHLQPPEFEPSFAPRTGLFFDATTLATIRERHDHHLREHGTSTIVERAAAAAAQRPEDLIDERVNFWDDTRFCREWKHGRIILDHGLDAAFAGILLRDRELLRLGARYAMAITMCDRWSDGPVSELPGSTFEQRGFIHSLCMTELSLILDLAGEEFTDLGRDVVLRRMAEQGVGATTYAGWRWDYLYEGNQLAWISPGRVLAHLTIEQDMPRARTGTDRAVADLQQNLARVLLPDGGYPESPMYFAHVMMSTARSLVPYGRLRDIPLGDLLPDGLDRCADYAETVMSTDPAREMIPTADCLPDFARQVDGLALLASRMPTSQWPGMYRTTLRLQSGGMPWTPLASALDADIPADSPAPRTWTRLPDTGSAASVRQLDGELVRLVVPGIVGGADHHHEDVGNFVLEAAGDTFAFDPGSTDYSDPLSFQLKWAQRHNVLTPMSDAERPRPEGPPIPQDVKAVGTGDERALDITVDNAIAGWGDWFTKLERRIVSEDPAVLVIEDKWDLRRGDGVAFHWQTLLPVTRHRDRVVITGRGAIVELEVPRDTTTIIDALPWLDGRAQHRIRFVSPATTGSMQVIAHIRVV